jgi:hypothetical protein
MRSEPSPCESVDSDLINKKRRTLHAPQFKIRPEYRTPNLKFDRLAICQTQGRYT